MTSLETKKEEVKTDASGDDQLTNVDADVKDTKIKPEPVSQEVVKPETNNDNNNNNGNGHVDGSNREGDNNDGGDDDYDDDDEEAQFESRNNSNEDSNNQVGASNDETVESNEAENDNDKTNLIVNYLPQGMVDKEFVELFEKFGKMKSCKIIRNKMTGYSYGFGFADFETHEQAIKAIEELNGHQLGDKKIKVAFARPAGQDIKQANLYVKNIPVAWNQDQVRKVFEPYGQIIQVRVIGNDRGVAFVLFDLRKQAQDALEAMNGKKLDGCEEPLEIKFAAEKKGEKRGSRGGRNRGSGRGDRNNQRSGSLSGMRNNQQNNMRNNRGNSDSRRSTSQGRGGNNMYNNRNNNGMNQYGPGGGGGGTMNGGGVGPARHTPTNRASRYAPFASPMHQAAPTMAQQPMNPYGYPQQQMLPYMMPNQMMQMQMGLPQPMGMGGGHQMNPYAMAPQMGPIGYAQPPMSQPSVAMNNMYNVASTTMNNAAQMQPQLGQPMNMRGAGVGGGGMGSSGGGGQQNDGVTLFVYNIGPDCDENELRDMFGPYGSVIRSNVVRKNPGGETKGFGFVTMKTRDQASAAISGLNNATKNGRTLQVSFKK